jgi:hypothetical protein
MARTYGHFFPGTRIDAVEIDGDVTAIGRRYFHLSAPHLKTITADARVFVRTPGPRYDVIILDAYRQPYIPFQLTTREFFEEVRERLMPGGVVLVNVGHPEGSDELEKVLAATMESSLRFVVSEPFDQTNDWLVGAMSRPRGARIVAARWRLPSALDSLASTAGRRIRPAPAGGEVYTDDHAPIEWLIDRSLLDYAEGHR